jgi:hypothetical protein
VGLLYRNPDAGLYNDLSSQGLDLTSEEKLAGVNEALDKYLI